MAKQNYATLLANLLEKELYTQERWEDRMSVVWAGVDDQPIFEVAERLVEHAVRTNVEQLDLRDIPRTLDGWCTLNNLIREWGTGILRKHSGVAAEQAVNYATEMLAGYVTGTIQTEANRAYEWFYQTHLPKVANQFILEHKLYAHHQLIFEQIIRQQAIYARNRFGLFNVTYCNNYTSRTYINGMLHQVIDALRDKECTQFDVLRNL